MEISEFCLWLFPLGSAHLLLIYIALYTSNNFLYMQQNIGKDIELRVAKALITKHDIHWFFGVFKFSYAV